MAIGYSMRVPPPEPTAEGERDPQVASEQAQLVRALQANGPLDPVELARLVGATYWDEGRYDRALALSVADGLVYRTGDGRVAAS